MTYRPIYEIAADIRADYADRGKSVHWSAKPYVEAMQYLDTMQDRYFEDDAHNVMTYALSNLSTWRGETAKRVKNEMRVMLGLKPVK